jgi:hypothetical protein
MIGSLLARMSPPSPRPRPPLLRRALLVAALAAGACATALPPPGPEDAARVALQWPGTTVEALDRGRLAYLGHCTSCHAAYPPQSQPAAAWRKIVDEMATRSKLDRASTEDVVRYLVAKARR